MRQFLLSGALLVGCGSTSLVAAQTPGLIDRPTPPPCAADGTCYPNTKAWGYYPVRWRTWPGSAYASDASKLEPTPADLGPELRPHETPPAELEDKQAPPATTKRAPPQPPGPADENVEGEPGPPPGPAGAPPGSPTSDADPPPAFPLSMSTPTRATDISVGTKSRLVAPRAAASDPPPSPPWGHRASL
jgi:hypothetical protein